MDFQYNVPLLSIFLLTSACVVTSLVYESKTLVGNYCPEVTNDMLDKGLEYGVKVYRYDLIGPYTIELTSLQALLLSLLNCLITQDRDDCKILANCSNRINQLRSRHVALWLQEDFSFPKNDMEMAMKRLDKLVADGTLVLNTKVLTTFSSLAVSYGITLKSEKKSSDLALELENAVANNIPCEIITLANEGAKVNGLTQSNESLVHLAVRSESMSSIATLGFLKADLDVLNAAGATPMEEAIKINSVPSINGLILAGANIEKQLSGGNSYLHVAASLGKNKALRKLLEAGLKPELKNHLGDTPLQLAVKAGNAEGVEILQEGCSNSSLVLEEGKSLVYKAVVSSNVDMFKAVIKCMTLLDLRFEYNDTLVHLIVPLNNATEMLKVLKNRRVPLDIRNNDGLAPIHIATDPSVVKVLLDMGADLTTKSDLGRTPLMLASYYGHLDVVKLLIDRGAPVNDKDKDGWTALHLAAENGQVVVVTLLLERGAGLTAKSNAGMTPLIYASCNGHLDVVKLLIDRGAPINEYDNAGWTALRCSKKYGKVKLSDYLESKGGIEQPIVVCEDFED